MEDFPARLRRLREQHGFTRKTLGELCGRDKNTIRRFERGERVPNINTAKILANIFKVTMDYLCVNEKNF